MCRYNLITLFKSDTDLFSNLTHQSDAHECEKIFFLLIKESYLLLLFQISVFYLFPALQKIIKR